MLIIHAAGSVTVLLIASCSFVFRVVGFIIDDSKKKTKKKNNSLVQIRTGLDHSEPLREY